MRPPAATIPARYRALPERHGTSPQPPRSPVGRTKRDLRWQASQDDPPNRREQRLMPSGALEYWQSELTDRLDDLERIHASATAKGRGRRWGTEQFNGQLFVALVGVFQSFARALHDDALDCLRQQSPVARQLADVAATNRNLDRGNPHPGSLGEDFGRLGIQFSRTIRQRRYGSGRIKRLDAAVTLRNGIAHGDRAKIAEAAGDGAVPTLTSYRRHRSAVDGLTVDMVDAVAHHLSVLTGQPRPW